MNMGIGDQGLRQQLMLLYYGLVAASLSTSMWSHSRGPEDHLPISVIVDHCSFEIFTLNSYCPAMPTKEALQVSANLK